MKRMTLLVPCLIALGVLVATAVGDESQPVPGDVPPVAPGKRDYSPYPRQDFPIRVFFGDTHLHTSYSTIQE